MTKGVRSYLLCQMRVRTQTTGKPPKIWIRLRLNLIPELRLIATPYSVRLQADSSNLQEIRKFTSLSVIIRFLWS